MKPKSIQKREQIKKLLEKGWTTRGIAKKAKVSLRDVGKARQELDLHFAMPELVKQKQELEQDIDRLRRLKKEAITGTIESMTDEELDAISAKIDSIKSVRDEQRELEERHNEYQGIKEYLEQDAVASYRVKSGTRKVIDKVSTKELGKPVYKQIDVYFGLTNLLTRTGDWPKDVTVKKVKLLLMGRELKPSTMTSKGRVKWEYVTDELADHFHMSEQELIKSTEYIRKQKTRMKTLKGRIDEAEAREQEQNQERQTSDILERFISDVCFECEGLDIKTSELYSVYKQWAENEGADRYILTPTAFELRMRDRYKVEIKEDGNYYRDVLASVAY
jgi:hypothetical protein